MKIFEDDRVNIFGSVGWCKVVSEGCVWSYRLFNIDIYILKFRGNLFYFVDISRKKIKIRKINLSMAQKICLNLLYSFVIVIDVNLLYKPSSI